MIGLANTAERNALSATGRKPEEFRSICELGCKGGSKSKHDWEAIKVPHVSIDLNGKGGALALDLQVPIAIEEIGGPFELVTNWGTTEHVWEQEPCWRNVHNLVACGGWLVSTTPAPGHMKHHGKYRPTIDWWRDFAMRNSYRVLYLEEICSLTSACLQKAAWHAPFQMPSARLMNVEPNAGKMGAY